MVGFVWPGACSRGCTFGPPKTRETENLRFGPATDLLEIRPEGRVSRRPRGRDAEAETARETENLVAWGGESGRDGANGGEGPAEFQKFSFSKKRTPRFLHWGSLVDPKQTFDHKETSHIS